MADESQGRGAEGARPRNFALLGAAGFVTPRHLKAIRDTGNTLVAAVDPHDSVGVLDQYFPEARWIDRAPLMRPVAPAAMEHR